MFFKPDLAEKLVKYLRAGDKGHAFLAAYDLVEDPDLAKTAVLPEGEYNDEELANLIEADLNEALVASVHVRDGQIVPRVLGYAFYFLEACALANDEEEDGESGATGSEPIEQDHNEEAAG